jgi:hypothetical protein
MEGHLMLRIILYILIVVPFFLVRAEPLAHLLSSEPSEKQCGFSELFRPEGWKIPGISGAVPKGKAFALASVPSISILDMQAGKSDRNLLLPMCSRDFPGRLIIRATPVRVLAMSRVDFKGKVFAYTAQYEPQTEADGVPHRSLEYTQVVFYDVDGSGRFSVMKYDMKGLFLRSPDVPEWAMRAGGGEVP